MVICQHLLVLVFSIVVLVNGGRIERDVDPYIVGGSITPVKTAVALFIQKKGMKEKDYKCAGTILSTDLVITAGHCVHGVEVKDIFIVAGEGNLRPYYKKQSSGWVEVPVKSAKTHPSFNFVKNQRYVYDVALLELSMSLPLSDNIGVARLPPPTVIYAGKEVRVGGWGTKGVHSTRPTVGHLAIDIQIKEEKECLTIYDGVADFCGDHMFCAGRYGKTTCHGDSGAGAIHHGWGVPIILGVVSFGPKTCSEATVFQKIEKSLLWIYKEVKLKSPIDEYYEDYITDLTVPLPSCQPAIAKTGPVVVKKIAAHISGSYWASIQTDGIFGISFRSGNQYCSTGTLGGSRNRWVIEKKRMETEYDLNCQIETLEDFLQLEAKIELWYDKLCLDNIRVTLQDTREFSYEDMVCFDSPGSDWLTLQKVA